MCRWPLSRSPAKTSPETCASAGARHVRVDYRRAAVLGDTIYPHAVIDGDRAVVSLTDAEGGVFAVVELR